MSARFQTLAAMACMKSCLMIFNLAFWTSGLIILCAGIWMQVELHKYLELSAAYNNLIPFIVVFTGTIIVFVATAACCCTVKGQPSLLYLYGFFLAVILVLQLVTAAAIYAYKDAFTEGFTRGLNDTMANYGTQDAIKTAEFDSMQSKLHCCGSRDYKDWNALNPPRPVPRSCCIVKGCDVQDETQIYTQVMIYGENFLVIYDICLCR